MKQGGANDILAYIYEGNLAKIKQLVEAGANVNEKSIMGVTPIHTAAFFGDLNISKYLVEKGADLNAIDNRGRRACDIAQTDELKDLLCEKLQKSDAHVGGKSKKSRKQKRKSKKTRKHK